MSRFFKQAVQNLSGCEYFGTDFQQITDWHCDDIEQPSQEEIETEIQRLEQEFIDNEYQGQRQNNYPPIGDQLDDLFKVGAFSEEMSALIQEVKDTYPKSE